MTQNLNGRVAFFGGSFDPPHGGHLAVARAARTALRLDCVLFAPVGAQPLKPAGSSASFDQRVAMTRLAIAEDPSFELSLADAPSPTGQPNYSFQTLLNLRASLPAGAQLFCLMGADSFRLLRQWREAARIPMLAALIVAARPGQPLHNLPSLLPEGLRCSVAAPVESTVDGIALHTWTLVDAEGQSNPLYLLPSLDEDVSATALRARAAGGIHAPNHLPSTVADYIQANELYR